MRILFISEHFHPEPNCIVSELAFKMASLGHDVNVVTAHPNYPLGQFYDSVRFPWVPVYSIEDGVRVWRLPMYPYHGNSKLRRGASYLSFLLISGLWCLITQLVRKPHRVIVYQTPFTMALSALPLKLLNSKIMYLCVDLWPESFLAAGVAPRGWLMKLMFRYSRWINQRANKIITSTKGMKRRYLEDGIPDSILHFVPVWVDGIPDPIPLAQPLVGFPRKIVYAGNLGPAQGLGVLLEALSKIDIAGSRIELEFIGSGSEESALKIQARELGLNSVTFRGRISPSEAFESLSRATASIIHLLPSPLFRMTLPSKIASCLASGTVVICGVDGEAAEMFEHHPAVHIFPSGDVQALAEIFKSISQASENEILERAKQCQSVYKSVFERQSLIEKYLTLCLG